ncbi:hypothetical protein QSH18_13615 [Xanthomonas sp. NCPPB 2654]|uniref:DUF7822 domain-containing protein n=1 Tax=unclassified Xanthomonas TaxID=2643310 RepID=UPI0021E0E783|nr:MULTISPECIES: hypothetical protein [unclassified Xanthomonas]MDL5366640.1 hypothetical protein [Xanthomonas sp. NCPPB 2654]UYC21202.1 hypothetical protein NUG20_02535 [Xanthomonas sp. CFBP 8443]
MANRSYLYSLSNRPASYGDRPDTISSLSEWAYDVPFVYRLLMSADPQLCASLVAEGLDDEDEDEGEDEVEGGEEGEDDDESEDEDEEAGADEDDDQPARLHAISSPFAPGLERVKRFAEIVKVIAAAPPLPPAPAPVVASPASLMGRLKQLFSPTHAPVEAPVPVPATVEHLPGWLDETVAFLEANRDAFLLLETLELDMMSAIGEEDLRHCVEQEIGRCREVGAAFEALPADLHEAATLLRRLAVEEGAPPLDVFHGLRFDDDCDSTRTGATERPLGLTNWSEVLYFELSDQDEPDADQAKD